MTRHVPEELGRDDWNAMVMHYLGLDHIGHKTGPNGPSMLPKQKEMDGIVQQIYEAMETMEHHANTLLVLAGDHGMNAGGNHGGSGPGETEPALLFASPKLKRRWGRKEYECPTTPKEGTEFHYYEKVEQSDIVPTLAGLMQFPVPKNNLGVFIDDFTGLWPDLGSATQLLHQGGKQMKQVIEAAYGQESFEKEVEKWKACWKGAQAPSTCGNTHGIEDELACRWALAGQGLYGVQAGGHSWPPAYAVLRDFLMSAQDALSSVASSYDVPRMVVGMLLSAVALSLAVLSSPSIWPPSVGSTFFALMSLLYGIMMFASSYVEEEQHFWYWLVPAWTVLLTAKSAAKADRVRGKLRLAIAGALILAVHRTATRWNQTGQKHAGESDVIHNFFPEHHVVMWMLILATYGYQCVMLARRTLTDLVPPEIAAVVAVVNVVPAIVFKLNFTQADAPELVQGLASAVRNWSEAHSLVHQAQVSFVLIVMATITVLVMAVALSRNTVLSRPGGPAVRVTLAERLHYLLTLFLMTQSRAPNVPLFLGLEVQRQALSELLTAQEPLIKPPKSRRSAEFPTVDLATSILLLSHTYFFCMGGSNSISSVDLSNAYNGVGDYNIFAVGVLLLASNWAGPIWWCSSAVLLTFAKPRKLTESEEAKGEGNRGWIDEERAKLHEDAQAGSNADGDGQQGTEHWFVYVSSMTLFVSTSLLAVMAACTALRTHLFIWTVFSPKYLYAMAWCVGWHLLMNVGLGSLLRWLGMIA